MQSCGCQPAGQVGGAYAGTDCGRTPARESTQGRVRRLMRGAQKSSAAAVLAVPRFSRGCSPSRATTEAAQAGADARPAFKSSSSWRCLRPLRSAARSAEISYHVAKEQTAPADQPSSTSHWRRLPLQCRPARFEVVLPKLTMQPLFHTCPCARHLDSRTTPRPTRRGSSDGVSAPRGHPHGRLPMRVCCVPCSCRRDRCSAPATAAPLQLYSRCAATWCPGSGSPA